jgi:hypothetical protein
MTFKIEGEKKGETPRAVLWEPKDTDLDPSWIPKSQIEEIELDEDNVGFVVISDWLAKKMGLEGKERKGERATDGKEEKPF